LINLQHKTFVFIKSKICLFMKKNLQFLLCLWGLILVLMPDKLYAQNDLITVAVLNEKDGTPIESATIQILPGSRSVLTGIDGKLTFPRKNAQSVRVSFIGYKTITMELGNQTSISVKLVPSLALMDEIVVVGYGGRVRKSDLTGSVSSLSSKEIRKQPVTNFGQAIQGKATGVVVSNNSGAPGAGTKIRIRGANSLLGGNDPLYVVDGVALNIGINDLNVNDIESVEILKDASSTAIYGSRGANGVIMITTKRGISGATKIQLTSNTGISNLAQKYDLLDAGSFAELTNVYKPNYFTAAQISDFKTKGGVDWQDEVFQTAVSQDYQVSLSGGTAATRYYVSGNYVNQTGIVTGADLSKYSIRSNISTELGKKFKLDLNLFASKQKSVNTSDNGSKGAPLWNTPLFPPTFSIYTPSGSWNRTDNLSGPGLLNPLMVLKERYSDLSANSVAINSKLTYNIFEGLKVDILFGLDDRSGLTGSITNKNMNPTITAASLSENKSFTWQNSNIISYQKKIGDRHDFTVMGAYEQSKFTYNGFAASGTNINPISVGYDNLGIANNTGIGSSRSQFSLQSYLGRFNYSYMSKYLLTASYRADGTSKFQGNNKWGYFPAVAAAWKISEEAFLKNQHIISNLKLRGSWGITGNQGINAYATISSIGTMSNSFGLPSFVPGSTVNGADNPDLKWETTEQKNIGFDISFLKGKINLTADYYFKNTSDLLNSTIIAAYNGGGSVNTNIGSMENNGYEINLSVIPVSNKNFHWEAGFNISAFKNKLTSLGKSNDTFRLGGIYAPGLTTESPFALKVGESLGSFWGYEWQGIYTTKEATEAAKYGFKPGDNKYRDLNSDGKIDSKDKFIIGNALPKFIWGFNNSFRYKNFEANILLQAVVGRKILNTVYAAATTILSDATAISHVDGKNYWSTDNENSMFANPKTSSGKNFIESTQFLQDGSYVKVRNLAVAYNFKRDIIKFADLKFTVSGQNLLTFTKYKGYDPETSTSGNDTDGAIDVGSFPTARTITFSLQVNF
jgi:TonB-linked SusC/RagA family outer membrane protein